LLLLLPHHDIWLHQHQALKSTRHVLDTDAASLTILTLLYLAAAVANLQQIRYIRIKHLVNETGDWRKVYTWEIGAYGAGGRWGLPPVPQQQSKTFRQLLGVNGIWGWGNKSFSDTLAMQVREHLCTHSMVGAAVASWVATMRVPTLLGRMCWQSICSGCPLRASSCPSAAVPHFEAAGEVEAMKYLSGNCARIGAGRQANTHLSDACDMILALPLCVCCMSIY
jgi:hypothetical protein